MTIIQEVLMIVNIVHFCEKIKQTPVSQKKPVTTSSKLLFQGQISTFIEFVPVMETRA